MTSISTRGGKNPFGMRTYEVCLIAIMLTIGLIDADKVIHFKIDTPIPCGNTSDCRSTLTLPRDAFCKDGYCMCPKEDNGIKVCSSINAFMHEVKMPGPLVYRTCKHNQDCKFEGGFCNNTISQCDCMKNYVSSKNQQHCVKRVHSLDASCTDQNQCLAFLANTTCENNKCVCISGYHYVDNACWRMAGYKQPCTKNQQCSHIEGVICTDMKCECTIGMVLNSDSKRCLMAADKIRNECTESIQCTATFEHSLCLDNTCQCESDYHYEHDLARCFPNKAIDDDCANNYECYQAEDYEENNPPIKSMMCEANRCTCAENYVRQDNKCVSAGSSSFGTSIIVSVITLFYSTLIL